MSILFLVESGAKGKKIASYLPSNYIVLASFGHNYDLKKKELGIDVNNNFKPTYKIVQDKNNLNTVSKITDAFKKCKEVIFAADDDREGEAIAWHLHRLLYKNDNPVKCNRVTFNEITKDAVLESLKNKRHISMPIVNSYQARRIIDRLVGFKLSPLLWKYIDTPEKSLSAGRCQSAVLLLLKNHQEKIKNHKSEHSYDLKCSFKGASSESKKIKLETDFKFNKLFSGNDKKDKDSIKFLLKVMGENRLCKITKNKTRVKKVSPPQPFITSTIQQAAQNELGYSIDATMRSLQKLYERHGLITYHRTDCRYTSEKFQSGELEGFINSHFGEDNYLPPKIKAVKGAQNAHEAIRITHIEDYKKLESINDLSDFDKKLYLLIFKRTIQSHMGKAVYDELSYELSNSVIKIYGSYTGTIKILKTGGYLDYNDKFGKIHDKYKKESKESKKSKKSKKNKDTPDSNQEYMNYFKETSPEDLVFNLQTVDVKNIENNPPQLHNESGLVKKLEDVKIGRPSTYSSIINTLYKRKYAEVKDIIKPEKEQEIIKLSESGEISEIIGKIKSQKIKKRIIVTELGYKVINYLDEDFHELIDMPFTAKVEDDLDRIAEGTIKWQEVVRDVYENFMPIVKRLNDVPYKKKTHTLKRENWENINALGKYRDKDIFIKVGKYGPYIQLLDLETNKSENIGLQKYLKDNGIENDIDTIGEKDRKKYLNIVSISNYIDEYYTYKKENKKSHISLGKYNKISNNIKKSKYGPYIQKKKKKNNIKPKFISMKNYFQANKIKSSDIKDIKQLKHIKIKDIQEYIK